MCVYIYRDVNTQKTGWKYIPQTVLSSWTFGERIRIGQGWGRMEPSTYYTVHLRNSKVLNVYNYELIIAYKTATVLETR